MASDSSKPVTWETPEGWKPAKAGEIQYATYQAGDDPKTLVGITMLPTRGGLSLQLLNRWRGQLDLPAATEKDVPAMVKPLDLPAGKANLVELSGSVKNVSHKMVVAYIVNGPDTWYFKIMGPAAKVDAQRANFDAFVQSVRFAASVSNAAPGIADGSTPSVGSSSLPAGWEQDPNPSPPRLAAYRIASGDGNAEVTITRFPGDTGGLLANINRWRGQVGLEPVAEVNSQGTEPVMIAGKESMLFDFAGPAKSNAPPRILVAMTRHGDDTWFFKMTGPSSLLAAQKEAFRGFLSSYMFPDAAAQ
jgi:hypothetical protein